MKALTDIRVQIIVGVIFFALALLDVAMTKANSFQEMSIVGKTSCIVISAILLYQIVVNLVGLIKGIRK